MLFKVADFQWEHPELEKYMREFSEGQFLFRQGQPGKTMFIIVRGVVALFARREGKDYLMEILEAGEFLGEKAVMSKKTHLRFFSAQARTEMKVLELGLKEIEVIQKEYPLLMTDILKSMFQIAASRLDRSNQVVAILRSSDNVGRFIALLRYMAHQPGSETPFGHEFFMNVDKIRYYIDMSESEVRDCLQALEKRGILVKSSENSYLLRNLKALEAAREIIADHLPALKAI